MKIKYEFLNETVELEVTDEWASIIADMDRLEYNNQKKETRRHYSIDACTYEGMDYAVEDKSITDLFKAVDEIEKLRSAMLHLSKKQQDLITAIYFKGMSVNEYAKREGVDHSAISHRLQTIYKKLKKFL